MTTHLAISARNCQDVPGLVAELRERYAGVPVRLSLHVRPPCAGVAYECLQRSIPDCRLVAAWSEPEALLAAGGSWPSDRVCWWPIDRHGCPDPQSVLDLVGYSEALDENTRRSLVVSLAGYRVLDGFIVPNGHSCQSVDVPCGPVACRRNLVTALVTGGLSGVPVAAWSLGMSVAITRRVPGYVVPTGPAVEMPAVADIWRALAIGKEAGWRARVDRS